MINKPSSLTAAVFSADIINQINNLLTNVDHLLTNGRPAEGANAAVSAADVQAGLGDSLAKVQAVIAAFK